MILDGLIDGSNALRGVCARWPRRTDEAGQKRGKMTTEQRQQSLEAARQGAEFLRRYIQTEIVDDRIRVEIAYLLAEFDRLDAKEQKQIKAGKRYGKLGAEHGKKGGRPRKGTNDT